MRRELSRSSVAVACAMMLGLTASAWAVPYASGIRNTGGNNYEFVLNQAASGVSILRTGDTPLDLGPLTAGRHTFTSAGAFEIEVSNNNTTPWAEISSPTNAFTKFARPNGLEVNNDPSSPYFGTVYVVNGNTTATTSPARTLVDGVYAMTADLIGYDPATKQVITDPNNTTLQGKSFSWTVAGSDSSPHRLALDKAGNLIISDWSDSQGGIKYAMADLSSGGLVLEWEDGIRPLRLDVATNSHEIHGSIVSQPYVTGSIGNNLVVYAMDEDYDLDGDTIAANSGNHIWKWNVGNRDIATSPYDGAPELVISASALTVNTADPVAPHPMWLNLNVGVDANLFYSEQYGKWYLTQNRNDGTEGGLIIVSADGVDGMTPTIEWSSIKWTLESGLDSFPDDTDPATLADNGSNDAFRGMGSAVVSPDGKYLYVHRRQVLGGANALYTGQSSNLNGAILVFPLDANGIPIIDIDDQGTPESTDDVITNMQSIQIAGNNVNKGDHEISVDAAGNIYIVSNAADSQRLQVFSPSGNFKAVTRSNGTFELFDVSTGGAPGDYDGDGDVDANDYATWKNSFGQSVAAGTGADGSGNGVIDAADYTVWRDNLTSGSGAAAVPEPTSAMLLMLGMFAGLCSPRRGRKAGA